MEGRQVSPRPTDVLAPEQCVVGRLVTESTYCVRERVPHRSNGWVGVSVLLQGWQPVHADLPLLDRGLFDGVPLEYYVSQGPAEYWAREMYDLLDVVEDLISRNADRLDEELITTFGIEGWLGFHRLEQDCGQGCQSKDWTTEVAVDGG